MIIVTGGFGLIGSHLISRLNSLGLTEIFVVDNLENGKKILNLKNSYFQDYMDYREFGEAIRNEEEISGEPIDYIFHLGACSTTTEWNGLHVFNKNFTFTKHLVEYCNKNGIDMTYASSASVYGLGSNGFEERRECEEPINAYAYSKLLIDRYVETQSLEVSITGLRFFNVYGPNEAHKGSMASPAFHFLRGLHHEGVCKLFGANEGYEAGKQCRDFVYVEDCVDVMLWCRNVRSSGLFNIGSGLSRTFQDFAEAVIASSDRLLGGTGNIEFIDFPEHLKGAYQSYTQASLSALRTAGYEGSFIGVEEGMQRYLTALAGDEAYRKYYFG